MSGRALHACQASRSAVRSSLSLEIFLLRLLVVLLLASCAVANLSAQEAAHPPRIIAARAGFSGSFKVGCWSPLRVEIRGGSHGVRADLEVVSLDGDTVPFRVGASSDPIEIGAGQTISVMLDLKVGQLNADVTIHLREGARLLDSWRLPRGGDGNLSGLLRSDRQLIVLLGDTGADQAPWSADRQTLALARVAQVRDLPEAWWAYEGVDTVVLLTSGDEISSQLASASRQLDALQEWVRLGGRVVLSVGRQAAKVLATESPLAKFAPGAFDAIVPLRQATWIESYVETSAGLDAGAGRFELQACKLRDARGKIDVHGGRGARDLPLVVRAPHGFGEVVFVAFDLNDEPIASWKSRPQLFDKLLQRSRDRAGEAKSGSLGQVTTLGFVDLSGQLHAALDQFSGVQFVPFWFVALLILAYVVLIGPLDYFFVKNLLRRMELTWLTLAATVLAFGAGAVALAYGLKGNALRVNQIELVDFDAQSGLLRGTTWVNIFSPRVDAFDLALRPRALPNASADPQVLFSWLGLPGNGFGGMDSAAGKVAQFSEPYAVFPRLGRVAQMPIATWSSKALVARWWQPAGSSIDATLVDRGKLTGALTSHLPFPLEDAVLFYDRWAYPLRLLQPERQLDVQAELEPLMQTADTFLRHVRVQSDRSLAPPYDRASLDWARIVEIMTCHELAGGPGYTGLAHEAQSFVDLSRLVADGRAVLVGRVRPGATQLERGAEPLAPEHTTRATFYRFVFDVREASGP